MSDRFRQAVAFAVELIEGTGSSAYFENMLATLRNFVYFDIHAVVHYPTDGAPLFVYDNFLGLTSSKAMTSYLAGTYLLDPVYTACRHGITGLHRLTQLAPDKYFESEYYTTVNLHPCVSEEPGSLTEELVYIMRLKDSSSLVISLMRLAEQQKFSDEDFNCLSELEPLIRAGTLKHWAAQQFLSASPAAMPGRRIDELEAAFADFAKDVLSSREQTVVSFLLRGHSTLSVAHNLGIAEGTAKNHRRNIYGKLQISSQAQLFLMFCNHILLERSRMEG